MGLLYKQPSNGGDEGEKERNRLVKKALALLLDIHQADQAEAADSPYDGMLVGMVYGLIDFIVLQGILPCLSPGVAFARRPRSVLVTAASTRTDPDYSLLREVVTSLLSAFSSRGVGIEPLISQRALPDVISAVAELSFSPNVSESTHMVFKSQYTELLDQPNLLSSVLQLPDFSLFSPRLFTKTRLHGYVHTYLIHCHCFPYGPMVLDKQSNSFHSLTRYHGPLLAMRRPSRCRMDLRFLWKRSPKHLSYSR